MTRTIWWQEWNFGSAGLCGTTSLGFPTFARGWHGAVSNDRGQLAPLPLPGPFGHLGQRAVVPPTSRQAPGARMPSPMLASWCARQLLTAEAPQLMLGGSALGANLKNGWWWQLLTILVVSKDSHPPRAEMRVSHATLRGRVLAGSWWFVCTISSKSPQVWVDVD